MTSLTKMPNFDPTKAGTAPPMISPAGNKMARNTGSRNWRNTDIEVGQGQEEFESSPSSEMENTNEMNYEGDDFIRQAADEKGRSRGEFRSRV